MTEAIRIDAKNITEALVQLVAQIQRQDPSLGGLKAVLHDGEVVNIKLEKKPKKGKARVGLLGPVITETRAPNIKDQLRYLAEDMEFGQRSNTYIVAMLKNFMHRQPGPDDNAIWPRLLHQLMRHPGLQSCWTILDTADLDYAPRPNHIDGDHDKQTHGAIVLLLELIQNLKQ